MREKIRFALEFPLAIRKLRGVLEAHRLLSYFPEPSVDSELHGDGEIGDDRFDMRGVPRLGFSIDVVPEIASPLRTPILRDGQRRRPVYVGILGGGVRYMDIAAV